MYRWDQKALLVKIEAVEGQDPTPTGGANAILARNFTFEPNPSTALTRDLVKPTVGAAKEYIVARHVQFSFDVEMAGAGGAGTAPPWGPLVRSCGMAETINAGVDVQYDPVSAGEESATAYFNLDGVNHAALMCRGNVQLVYEPNEIPRLRFAFMGLHVNPAAVALPTADFSAFQDALEASKVNTPTFSLHGLAGVLRSCTADLGQKVVFRDLVGAQRVDIAGRAASGAISIEAPAIGTKDFFAAERAETLAALQIIHGTAAGNIVQLDAPKVQVKNPRYEQVDGIVYLPMDLNIAEDTGDDELKITVK